MHMHDTLIQSCLLR